MVTGAVVELGVGELAEVAGTARFVDDRDPVAVDVRRPLQEVAHRQRNPHVPASVAVVAVTLVTPRLVACFAVFTGGQGEVVPLLRWTLARSDSGLRPHRSPRNARLMRRLAMVAVTGLVAFSQLGPDSSSGAASPSPAPASAASPSTSARLRSTALDDARRSLPLPKAAVTVPERKRPAPRASRSATGVRGDVWAALARCESGGNPAARSANGRYTGAFQFSNATWQSLGYEGSASDHPYAVQVAAAQKLQARSGWGQWPRCSRVLGLR